MRAAGRAWLQGFAVALAIAFPPTVVAQIVDAVRDDDIPAAATVVLTLIVLTGPVVGAYVAGRGRRARWGVRGATIGAVCLLVIAVFGAIRQAAADEDTTAFAIPVLAIAGGVLGFVGDRAASAARRRP